MLFDLFSSFDYKFFGKKYFMWLIIFVSMMILVKNFNTYYFLFLSLNTVSKTKFNKNIFKFKISSMFKMVFMSLVVLKFLGLVPYMFSCTSHISLIFLFSVFFWVVVKFSSILFKILKYYKNFVPKGSPLLLGGFLSLMEIVSKFIRPITLSLRLGINITTGHIFLSLLGTSIIVLVLNLNYLSLGLLVVFVFYLFFELFVCVIQGFVFSLLLSQYIKEHTN